MLSADADVQTCSVLLHHLTLATLLVRGVQFACHVSGTSSAALVPRRSRGTSRDVSNRSTDAVVRVPEHVPQHVPDHVRGGALPFFSVRRRRTPACRDEPLPTDSTVTSLKALEPGHDFAPTVDCEEHEIDGILPFKYGRRLPCANASERGFQHIHGLLSIVAPHDDVSIVSDDAAVDRRTIHRARDKLRRIIPASVCPTREREFDHGHRRKCTRAVCPSTSHETDELDDVGWSFTLASWPSTLLLESSVHAIRLLVELLTAPTERRSLSHFDVLFLAFVLAGGTTVRSHLFRRSLVRRECHVRAH